MSTVSFALNHPGVVFPSHHEKHLIREWLGSGRGVFVEVGAGEPIRASQSHHLEMGGWTGLLVEPSPVLANALRASRRATVTEAACVGRGAPPVVDFWIVGDEAKTKLAPGDYPRAQVQVPASTLDDLLVSAGMERVDFVSVDVSGMEADVLSGFSARRFGPSLILVDDRHDFARTRRLLSKQGYALIRRSGQNAWFVPRETLRNAFIARLQISWHYGPARSMRRLMRAISGVFSG